MPFDAIRAQEPIDFISLLKLPDDFYGQPFVLQNWQTEIIKNVYGTVNNQRLRQYAFAYLEIPKKNGKTTLIAALGLYHITCDEPGGQIYCCAADREQASLVYNAMLQMIEQDEDLQSMLKITDSKKVITNRATGTFLKVLSAEAYTKHGLNPTVVIFDELHAQPNRNLWDVMTFGSDAARKETLYWVITTAGDDPDKKSIGWEQHEYARAIRDGEKIDPYWYVKIYGASEKDDIFDEALWYRVNPSLGVTINIDKVRKEAVGAKNDAAKEKLFRWLRLNQWVSLKRTNWLPLTLWDDTVLDVPIEVLLHKKCYGGLDLSSTTDITGLKLIFPPQPGLEKWYELSFGWIPEESMKERSNRDHVPYNVWVKNEELFCTPGEMVDYDYIEEMVIRLSQEFDIVAFGIDPWNSRMLTQRLEKNSDCRTKLVEISQDFKMLSPAMKEKERLMRSGMYAHDNNPVSRWCFGNVNIAVDGNENIKPMKNRSIERIDLEMAGIIAMALIVKLGANKANAYESHGLRSLAD